MNQSVRRSLNFELLRIIAMIMVILLHVNNYGIHFKEYSPQENLACFFISNFFEYLCIIAVNLYVLISGYFLSASLHPFKTKKLIHIVIVTVFWSWFIGIFACIFLDENINDFLYNGIFPIMSGRYWFVTNYVLLYFLSPYYNKVLQMLTKHEHLSLILFLTFFFVLVPLLWDSVGMNKGYSLYWFSYLYIVASFIRKYNISFKNRNLFFIWSVTLFLHIILGFILKQFVFLDNKLVLIEYNSIFSLVNTICFFLLFKSFSINKYNKIIQAISSLTFGVYLIHSNPATISFIFEEIFPIRESAGNNMWGVFFSLIFFTLIIFVLSATLEYLRMRIFTFLKVENLIYGYCVKIKTLLKL